jgi:hypothetical protein
MKSILKKFIVPTCIVTIAIIGVILAVRTNSASAGPSDNVTGWALSDMPTASEQIPTPGNPYGGKGLGWISLNDTNTGSGGGSYGINLGTDGKFTGKAWSENGGWLDFQPAGIPVNAGAAGTATTSGASVSPTCLADDTQACQVTGWIRFTGAPSDPWNGGWDGWVSMSGTNYKVMLSAATPVPGDPAHKMRTLSGYAWGDRVVGWVNFQWAVVTLPTIIPPECQSPLVPNPNNPNQPPLDCVCPGTFTAPNPVTGSCEVPPQCPTPYNYPKMTGYDKTCACVPRPDHREDCPVTDMCPDTKFDIPGDPRTGTIDLATQGTQTSMPVGYSVSGSQCGIFGCAEKGKSGYNPNATIDVPSLCSECTAKSPDYNLPLSQKAGKAICSPCHPGVKGYNEKTGLCPTGPKTPVYIET